LTYIISYFDTYDCTHNGDESPKDSSYIIGEEYVCCFCRKNQLHGRVSQL